MFQNCTARRRSLDRNVAEEKRIVESSGKIAESKVLNIRQFVVRTKLLNNVTNYHMW